MGQGYLWFRVRVRVRIDLGLSVCYVTWCPSVRASESYLFVCLFSWVCLFSLECTEMERES